MFAERGLSAIQTQSTPSVSQIHVGLQPGIRVLMSAKMGHPMYAKTFEKTARDKVGTEASSTTIGVLLG